MRILFISKRRVFELITEVMGLFNFFSALLLLLVVESTVCITSNCRPTGHFHVSGNENRRKDCENTGVVIKLLRSRRNYVNTLFSVSHLAAFLRCISTTGARSSSSIEALEVFAKTASTSALHPDQLSLSSLFSLSSLPSEGSVAQIFISFCSHFLCMYLLREFPRLRKLINFFETDDLDIATAAFIEKDKSVSEGSTDRGGAVIVKLDATCLRSADELDLLLELIPKDDSRQLNAAPTPAASTTGGTSAAGSTVRTLQLDDLKCFIIQKHSNNQQIIHRKRSKKEAHRFSKTKRLINKARNSKKSDIKVMVAQPPKFIKMDDLCRLGQKVKKSVGAFDSESEFRDEDKKGFGPDGENLFGMTSLSAKERNAVYGDNSISLPSPSLWGRITDHFLSPMYILETVFQFLSVLEEPLQIPLGRIMTSVFYDSVNIKRDHMSVRMLDNAAAAAAEINTKMSSPADIENDASNAPANVCTVVRDGTYVTVHQKDLVPGDVVRLSECTVPADCLLLYGTCVVDEAIMTGEAVPQPKCSVNFPYDFTHTDQVRGEGGEGSAHVGMKESHESASLDLGKQSTHIIFSGSKIVQCTNTKNQGQSTHHKTSYVTCLVLRTGFNTASGDLFRKIKASKNSKTGSMKYLLSEKLQGDVFKLLIFMSTFALWTSIYVYMKGRAIGIGHHRLLIQIARIFVSVASPEIRKDITFTVAKSVRRLTSEEKVYCTDKSKLSVAGLVTTCLFDKTGTITTDVVVADTAVTLLKNVSVQTSVPKSDKKNDLVSSTINSKKEKFNNSENKIRWDVESKVQVPSIESYWTSNTWKLSHSPKGLQMVIACCHSAMELELFPPSIASSVSSPHKHPLYVGDALECALLNGIVDQIPDLGSDSRPKSGSWNVRVNEKTAVWVSGVLKREAVIGDDDIGVGVGVDGGGGKSVAVLEGRDFTLKTVLTHEFDAAVQRMTVIALVTHTETNKNESKNTHSDRIDSKSKTEFQHDYLVAMKGSPESVFLCLKREHQKDEKFKNKYFLEYEKLAKMGKRVIAFASKRILDLDSVGSGRENAEKDLVFQGFVAFACPLRSDSEAAIAKLKNANIKVAMITGDSLLTALYAAKECSIIGVKRNAEHSLMVDDRVRGSRDNIYDGDNKKKKSTRKKKRDGDKNSNDDIVLETAKSVHIDRNGRERENVQKEFRVQDNIDSPTLILTVLNEERDLISSNNGQLSVQYNNSDADQNERRETSFSQEVEVRRNSGFSGPRSLVWCNDGGVVMYRYSHGALNRRRRRRGGGGGLGGTVQSRRNRGVDKTNSGIDKGVGKDRNKSGGVTGKKETTFGSVSATLNINNRNPAVDKHSTLPSFSARELSGVGGFDLGVTGEAALFLRNIVWEGRTEGIKELSLFKVFARVDPDTKSVIVDAFKQAGETVLMCGDGTNDMAALSTAHVGVALLTGFNLANTNTKSDTDSCGGDNSMKRLVEDQVDVDVEDEIASIGDASRAASFTSREPSIQAVVNIIRHGQAAQALLIQSFQVAALESVLRGNALSVLFLHSVRGSAEQIMVREVLSAFINFGLLQVPPAELLSSERPLRSAFTPKVLISITVQLLVHIGSILLGLGIGRGVDAIKRVIPSPSADSVITAAATDVMLKDKTVSMGDEEYRPSAVNTAMFLMSLLQMISIPLGTYPGMPFLPDMTAVAPLKHAMLVTGIVTLATISEVVPGLSAYLQTSPLTRSALTTIFVLIVCHIALVVLVGRI